MCAAGGVCGGGSRDGSEWSSTRDSFRGRVLKYSGAEEVVVGVADSGVVGVDDGIGFSEVGVGVVVVVVVDSFPFRRFTMRCFFFLRPGVPSDIVLLLWCRPGRSGESAMGVPVDVCATWSRLLGGVARYITPLIEGVNSDSVACEFRNVCRHNMFFSETDGASALSPAKRRSRSSSTSSSPSSTAGSTVFSSFTGALPSGSSSRRDSLYTASGSSS